MAGNHTSSEGTNVLVWFCHALLALIVAPLSFNTILLNTPNPPDSKSSSINNTSSTSPETEISNISFSPHTTLLETSGVILTVGIELNFATIGSLTHDSQVPLYAVT